jgi:hypothetical protein
VLEVAKNDKVELQTRFQACTRGQLLALRISHWRSQCRWADGFAHGNRMQTCVSSETLTLRASVFWVL